MWHPVPGGCWEDVQRAKQSLGRDRLSHLLPGAADPQALVAASRCVHLPGSRLGERYHHLLQRLFAVATVGESQLHPIYCHRRCKLWGLPGAHHAELRVLAEVALTLLLVTRALLSLPLHAISWRSSTLVAGQAHGEPGDVHGRWCFPHLGRQVQDQAMAVPAVGFWRLQRPACSHLRGSQRHAPGRLALLGDPRDPFLLHDVEERADLHLRHSVEKCTARWWPRLSGELLEDRSCGAATMGTDAHEQHCPGDLHNSPSYERPRPELHLRP
mmetsp:Transcript_63222/g.147984  ORF Transcript_63222/g.147984 Transcript_63222/m.147984 type:complete len:271 (-) Transcript_63222:1949-2761(-)